MQETALATCLQSMSRTKKSIFAILCADRCVRIFDYNYLEGAPELQGGISVAIGSVYSVAEHLSEIKEAIARLEKVIPDLDEVGSQHTCAMGAGVSVLYALNAVISGNEKDVILASSNALDAVDSFSEYNGQGRQEELLWQERALRKLQGLPERTDIKQLRDALNSSPPAWEREWL